MAIYITGDTHGELDIHKLSQASFPEGRNLTKDDYVIICGDFGLVWGATNEKTSLFWQKWLKEKPWTTLFVDGNHEDFDLLNSYPVTEWHGGRVHQINDSIIHLMRGEIYNIDGYKLFAFGGAFSHDRYWRKEGESWWQAELPNHDEVSNALNNLEKNNNEVDIIITHDSPKEIVKMLGYNGGNVASYDAQYEDINVFLQYVKENITYKEWFMGHYHIEKDIGNHHFLYDRIVPLSEYINDKV